MTKKDYVLIAKALNNVCPYRSETLKENVPINKEAYFVYCDVVDSLCDELIKDNPLFNKDKFKKYCDVINLK